jgi:hypothetical protein
MSQLQLRLEIAKCLTLADERLLNSVFAMLKSYLEHENPIIGHTTDGKPLTKTELVQLLEKSHRQANNGNSISAEMLLAEVEKW